MLQPKELSGISRAHKKFRYSIELSFAQETLKKVSK